MLISDEKSRRFAANSIFPLFFCSALGLVLSQAGAVRVHGPWGLHVFLGMPGLVLSGAALFRARRHWAAAADVPSVRTAALRWYVLLLATGVCIGALVSAGSATLVGVVAALTFLLPWAKIPTCRVRFVWSSVAILSGAVAWVVAVGMPAQSLYLMIAAWMLYACSMVMYFLVLVSLDYGYRIGAPRFTDKPDDCACSSGT